MLILFWRPMEGEARWGFQALWQAKVGRPTFEALVSSISKNGPFLSVILVETSSSTHCPDSFHLGSFASATDSSSPGLCPFEVVKRHANHVPGRAYCRL